MSDTASTERKSWCLPSWRDGKVVRLMYFWTIGDFGAMSSLWTRSKWARNALHHHRIFLLGRLGYQVPENEV